MNLLILSIAICLLCQPWFVSSDDGYRLPTAVQPEHYKVQILTHLGDEEGFKFTGKVWIKILCNDDTHNITLHSKHLNLDLDGIELRKVSDDDSSEKSLPLDKTEFDEAHDFLILYPKQRLQKGQKYLMLISFDAELTQGLLGYYRSSYIDQKTQKKLWLSVTQFESTFARRAFPCFDEPEMKAKFEIILGHEKHLTALSNMPINRTEEMEGKPGWIWDHFDETVPMSTYLVAYSINEFDFKESMVQMSEDVLFKIWARRDAIDQVEYARYIGPKVLKFYENYFDIKFPLPKVDMIAIPDFSAGAMENWGLVTYRETALLYSPNVSSASSQHRVASVVAHELAHQWFGNLVTMKWWTDLWLNEGFATYVASLGVDYLHPEWNSFVEESVENTLGVFKFDSLKSSHPVSVPIGDPAEIAQIFDKISYEKGSSIIRMMHLFLGENAFRFGVSSYLKKHKYGNAEQDNLWECLTEEAHRQKSLPEDVTVKQIMDTWTVQTGYPIVSVERNYDEHSATVSQMRYLADVVRPKSELDACWCVPLSYTNSVELNFNSTQPKAWLKCDDSGTSIVKNLDKMPDKDQWVIFNIQLSGLYKVKYDQRNWDLLINQLSGPEYYKINAINRAQLIDDALDLAWSGDQDYGTALRIVEYLKQEKEYIPWKAALDNLNSVNIMLKRTAQYGLFKDYMKKVLNPIFSTIGGLNADRSDHDQLDAVKHKVLIASWSCRFEVGDCEEKSRKLFKKWMAASDPNVDNPIPLDLRSVVYCTAIRHGKEEEWNFLWKRYNQSNVGTEKTMILTSLSCTQQIWLLARYLEWTIDESSGIRKQDSGIVFGSIARTDVGFHLAREFLEEKIEQLFEYLQPDTARLARYIKPLANQMVKMRDYEQLEAFVNERTKIFEKSSKSIKQSLETIEINSQWQRNNYNSIGNYLRKYA